MPQQLSLCFASRLSCCADDDGYGGVQLVKTSEPCECGGTTGVCGTAEGARKYRAHISSRRHQEWEERGRAESSWANAQLVASVAALNVGGHGMTEAQLALLRSLI